TNFRLSHSVLRRQTEVCRTLVVDFEDCKKRLLRNLYFADSLHTLLALFLLLQQLALSGDVAPIALGDHVLAKSLHRFAGDYLAPDSSLNWNLEELPRYQLPHFFHQRASPRIRKLAVDDQRQRIDRLAGHKHVELDQIAVPIAGQLV